MIDFLTLDFPPTFFLFFFPGQPGQLVQPAIKTTHPRGRREIPCMGYLTFRGFIELLYSLLRPDSEFITAQPKPKSSLPPTTFLFLWRDV